METKEINVTLNGEQKELIIRHGVALPDASFKKSIFTGNVEAPANFVDKVYGGEKEQSDGIVIINIPEKKVSVETILGTQDKGCKIIGILTENPALLEFGINTGRTFGGRQLQNVIRKNAHVFESIDKAKELIKLLQNFSVSFEQLAEEEDDRHGSKSKKFSERIKISKGQLPESLKLLCPVYKDTPSESFEIEIELDRQGNEVVYSFYSVGFEDRVEQITKQILQNAVTEKCRELFPVITIS